MKRWIAVIAAAGLLVQGTASAWMAPRAAATPATDAVADTAAVPCHGDAPDAPAEAAQPAIADCCDGDCACSALCSGHATATAPVTALAPMPEPQPERAPIATRVHAAYALTPLRPPIASQS